MIIVSNPLYCFFQERFEGFVKHRKVLMDFDLDIAKSGIEQHILLHVQVKKNCWNFFLSKTGIFSILKALITRLKFDLPS